MYMQHILSEERLKKAIDWHKNREVVRNKTVDGRWTETMQRFNEHHYGKKER